MKPNYINSYLAIFYFRHWPNVRGHLQLFVIARHMTCCSSPIKPSSITAARYEKQSVHVIIQSMLSLSIMTTYNSPLLPLAKDGFQKCFMQIMGIYWFQSSVHAALTVTSVSQHVWGDPRSTTMTSHLSPFYQHPMVNISTSLVLWENFIEQKSRLLTFTTWYFNSGKTE